MVFNLIDNILKVCQKGSWLSALVVILHLFRWREKNSDWSALQVLNAMTSMDPQMFKKHLPEFYPYFTKLICSDQVSLF
jgi:hypothetical protein